jgi:type II secretory pathway component PulF
MALYFYQAFSKDGRKVTGYLDATSVQGVKDQLSKQGIYPTKIELSGEKGAKKSFFASLLEKRIGLKERIFFTKQLSVLLKSGIPILQALDLLIEQTEGKLKNIVISLRDYIKEGRSLAEGLQKFPNAFDTIYIQLVRAGEATGKLDYILDKLNTYLEKQETLRKKVSSALRGPMIQLGIIGLISVGLLNFVVPQIASAFIDMNVALPLPTRMLIALSNGFRNYYWLIALILVSLYFAYRSFRATASGGYLIDKLKLKIPLFGRFTKIGAIVQFCRTFGMLIEGGVNLAEALDIVVKITDNKILAETLQRAKENIIKQGKISQYLKETGLFPPVAIYLINTGEQSGQLGNMLLSVAQYYEDELSETADSLTALLNPMMMIIMALIVGFMIISILLPIQNITNASGEIK